MLLRIMRFIDRTEEMARLERLVRAKKGALAVVYGRRRLGKTRMLLEWVRKSGGLYSVADLSASEVQRRYFAQSVSSKLPGFGDVSYPDWRLLLSRLASEARAAGWRGPIVFDEFPYLVLADSALPSLVQRWVDHEAREAGLVVALAGSSQRMMQGLVLSREAPLFGRASEVLEVRPLDPSFLRDAFRKQSTSRLVEHYAAWGGVPRYWELALEHGGLPTAIVSHLVLDPLGPLHREPDRLLVEEIPSALEVRPVLDAIGSGAHRVSEIAARVGRPATSVSRPIGRLVEMGIVRREIPFAESEKQSRRSLYKFEDPFFRLWFRLVAPHRAQLAAGSSDFRDALLERQWLHLAAAAWEELCRRRLPFLAPETRLSRLGPWGPASRWWRGNQPEWDVVSESIDGKRLLLGDAKWTARRRSARAIEIAWKELASRRAPDLGAKFRNHEVTRALFVPEWAAGARASHGKLVVTARDLLRR